MINFRDEIARFKPSLEVENIENAITGTDLTDMNDLMMDLIRNGAQYQDRTPVRVMPAAAEPADNSDGL